MGFYCESRAIDAVPLEDDGDMLLYQWGTYDWGDSSHFEVNLTRQFILQDGEDQDIWQLLLTYCFPPQEVSIPKTSGERWCHNPSDVPSFSDFVLNSPPLAWCSQRIAKSVELRWENV